MKEIHVQALLICLLWDSITILGSDIKEPNESIIITESQEEKLGKNITVDFPSIHSLKKRAARWGNYDGADLDELFANFGTNREDADDTENIESHPRGQHHEDRPRGRSTERHYRRRPGRRKHRHRERDFLTLPTAFPGVTGETTDSVSTDISSKDGNPVSEGRQSKHPSSHLRIHSGQNIRLAGGLYFKGRVEIRVNGKWGVICDDSWDLQDAHVVCKQLGFPSGAKSAIGGSAFGYGAFEGSDIVMDETDCTGREGDIRSCKHLSQHDCTISELASVECNLSDGCEDGWVSHNGLCYKLMPQLATFNTANEKCEQLEAEIVNIENQLENDFLSQWLMTTTNETFFFTGGNKVTNDGLEYWKWQGTPYHVNFTKWFPGWPPDQSHQQPSNHTGQDCITLARKFYDPHFQATDVDYYYWNDAPCTVRLPYVCEKVAHGDDCYEGHGEGYRGNVFRTEKGTLCQKWTQSSMINPHTQPGKGLGEHNYCRNPDNDSRPWCWVRAEKNEFGYCALKNCSSLQNKPVTMGPPTAESASLEGLCKNNQFPCRERGGVRCIPERWRCDRERDCLSGEDESQCGTEAPTETSRITCSTGNMLCNSTNVCIPARWRCDGDRDCFDGEDEEGCGSDMAKLIKTENSKLVVTSGDRIINQVTYINTDLRECARLCLHSTNFICRSFNLRRHDKECSLSTLNSAMTGAELQQDDRYNYYEVKIQAEDCRKSQELFLCNNGRCIERHLVCDGVDQCHDFSDEEACGSEEKSMGLRLADGSGEHEGRVEVSHLGEWGVVCDDHWDLLDANVVCKQLGYSGAVRSTTLSHFGSGNSNFLLDEVQCTGSEETLDECQHDPWKKHDCLSYEVAGVECRTHKVCDDESQFRCEDSSCIPVSFICDGESDCSTGAADEKDCNEVKVELVGGTSPTEGRLEVIINTARGTVCDDDFDEKDAAVICRMLAIPGPASVAYFGPGSGYIMLDNLACAGTEGSIAECKHKGWATHNCKHSEDVGVRCGVLASTTTAPHLPLPHTPQPYDPNGEGATCGVRPIIQPSFKIIGGYTTLYGAYPWQAGVQKEGWFGGFSHHCGATIISNQWLLSAAHCFEDRPKESFRIVVGDYDLYLVDLHQQIFEVEEVIMHYSFDGRTNDYDFALVKVAGEIRMSDHVQPACLPAANQVYEPGLRCFISGWGSTGSHVSPRKLKAAVVPLIPRPVCKQLYKFTMSERMFCAGYLEGNVDSCQGDSGGPLVCHHNGTYQVYGVTSWGLGCAKPNAPGIYAKVSRVISWIKTNIDEL